MGKVLPRRELTGCIRRGKKVDMSIYRRVMALSHLAVGFRWYLQLGLAVTGRASDIALQTLSQMTIIHAAFLSTGQIVPATTMHTLICAHIVNCMQSSMIFMRLFRLDHELHDVPPEEEDNHPSTRMPRQNIHFDSWTDQEAYGFTSFTKDQLMKIYHHFGLAAHAAQSNGSIRVPTGADGRNYLFHPEELFLFLMSKCKMGFGNKAMCDLIFGGHISRWSKGYPWLLAYLDDRYSKTLSHETLRSYVHQFPEFHEKISKFMQKTATYHNHDGTAVDRGGLNNCPFRIFGFVDCSIDKISRPRSGPDGDYIGAPRKPQQDAIQRSVYTGYKKLHGIKVETVLLPNGISTIFGPVSARIHDVGGVMLMSGLDDFLWDIQQNMPWAPYSCFGDSTYNAQHLRCTRSYYRSLIPGVPLTPQQELCNARIKPARQTIEFSYGEIENIFQICSQPRCLKLAQVKPYAQEQLRVCHLLSNIYTCLNGNKASSYMKFNCIPPPLDDYLRL